MVLAARNAAALNNAAVAVYGPLTEIPLEDARRLFDVNFWGDGSLVAVSHLKRTGGALINIGSVVSDRPMPLQGMTGATAGNLYEAIEPAGSVRRAYDGRVSRSSAYTTATLRRTPALLALGTAGLAAFFALRRSRR